jgi:hypothetical protein
VTQDFVMDVLRDQNSSVEQPRRMLSRELMIINDQSENGSLSPLSSYENLTPNVKKIK